MTERDVRTDQLVAETQRIADLLSTAAGELSAFVQQLRAATKEVREEGHEDGSR